MEPNANADPRHDAEERLRREVALFRYGLIADLVHLPPGTAGIRDRLRAKAEHQYTIPGTLRTRVAAETLRDWLQHYRRGGFDALYPKPRADLGRPRRLPPEVAELLIAVKTAHPCWSVRQVIDGAGASGQLPDGVRLAHSTVHRLLRAEGLTTKRAAAADGADRRRFAYRFAGQLWMSDVLHGPSVADGRRRRKSYLIGFLDDATRVCPFAAFAAAENTAAFLPVFKQALIRRGLPQRLYVDNGANYRSQHLALICAKLGVALIHSRPHQPQGRGKIERFFRTVRGQLLSSLTPPDTASLDALNRRLWAYLEGEYHQNPHRGLDGDTPLQRWAAVGGEVRYLDESVDLDDLFLAEARRRVMNDRTLSLNGRLYEVDPLLVGQTVTVRYDPAVPPTRPLQVLHNGADAGQATILDAYANASVKRARPSRHIEPDTPAAQPPPSPLALRDLDRRQRND